MPRDMIEIEAPVDQQALVRQRWIAELRRQGHRQCVGAYKTGDDRVCALGLLLEIAVPDDAANPRWDDVANVGRLIGIVEPHVAAQIAFMNDGTWGPRHTFAEIADVVEGWFR